MKRATMIKKEILQKHWHHIMSWQYQAKGKTIVN